MMRLTPARVREAGDHAIASLGDASPDQPDLTAALGWLGQVLDAYPWLTTTFDYGWTRDPASYRLPQEVLLQAQVLRFLAEADPADPAIANHRPFVVRVATGLDFASTSTALEPVNVIVVENRFLAFAVHAALLSCELIAIEARLPRSWRGRARRRRRAPYSWGAERCDEIVEHFFDDAAAAVERFLGRIGNCLPVDQPGSMLSDWHLECLHGLHRYLIGHEMSLRLIGHDGPRKFWHEVQADRATLALTARHRAADPANADLSLLYGAPVFFDLGRLYLRCSAAMDAASGREPRTDYEERLIEAETRWTFFQEAAAAVGVEPGGLRVIQEFLLPFVEFTSTFLEVSRAVTAPIGGPGPGRASPAGSVRRRGSSAG